METGLQGRETGPTLEPLCCSEKDLCRGIAQSGGGGSGMRTARSAQIVAMGGSVVCVCLGLHWELAVGRPSVEGESGRGGEEHEYFGIF